MKNYLKNILFVLALVLSVVGTFLISGSADDTPKSSVTVEQNGITVTKSVRQKYDKDGNPVIGRYIIDFDITGQDVVTVHPMCSFILLDNSTSMINNDPTADKSKWPNAKEAVAQYTQTLLESNPENKFFLTTFSTNYYFYNYTNGTTSNTSGSFSSNPITVNQLSINSLHPLRQGGTSLFKALYNLRTNVNNGNITIPDGCKPVIVIVSDGAAEDYLNGSATDYPATSFNSKLFHLQGASRATIQSGAATLNGKQSAFLKQLQSEMDIFAIAYSLNDVGETLEGNQILQNMVTDSDYFMEATVGNIVEKMEDIANTVSALAEGANLVEEVNSPSFKLISENKSVPLAPLNSTSQHVEYEIEIDKNLPTGIYPTNDVSKTKIELNGDSLIDINASPSILWQKPDYDVYYHYEVLNANDEGVVYKGKKYNEVKDNRGKFSGLIDEVVNVNPYITHGTKAGFNYFESNQSPAKLVFGEDNRIDIYYTRNSYRYRIEYYYENENNKFVIDNNETITGSVPYGTEISYTEKPREKYILDEDKLTPSNGNIIISENADDNVIRVYYKRIYDLNIIKQVKKYNEDTILNSNDTFNFKIEFTDKDNNKINGTYQYEKNGVLQNEPLTFTNGVSNITLKSKDSIKILNLDKGLKYTITETTNEGYIVEVKDSSNRIKTTNKYEGTINGDSEVTYINTFGCELAEAGSPFGLLLTIIAVLLFSTPIINKAYNFKIDRCISRHLNG